MKRNFLPVGQGAFYCEDFAYNNNGKTENLFVVYDCGSRSKDSSNILEQLIKTEFVEGAEIAAVFISHFHSDHVNGLEKLLKHCNVHNIFLPLVTEENRTIISLSDCIAADDDFTLHFLQNPWEAVRDAVQEKQQGYDIHVIPVKPYDNGTKFSIADDFAELPDADRVSSFSTMPLPSWNTALAIPSGRDIWRSVCAELAIKEPSVLDWKYIPSNFEQEEKLTELKGYLKRFGDISGNKLGLLYKESANNRKLIEESFKLVSKDNGGEMNSNSMTVLSIFMSAPHLLSAGCLYTGDFDAKHHYEHLGNAYKNFEADTVMLQVPHHGAKSSYDTRLANDYYRYYVISAGKDNNYRHPSAEVVADLQRKKTASVNIVTENSETKFTFDTQEWEGRLGIHLF